MPPKTSIQQVVDELMAYEPKKIILFGSAARGDEDEYSDIDLIIGSGLGVPRTDATSKMMRDT